MNIFRIGMMLGACSALTAAVAGCGDSTPPPSTTGSIEAHIGSAPGAVQAIYITVTGSTITGDIHTSLLNNGGTWSGSLAVPPGTGDVVTAYAYDVTTPALLGGPEDLIYMGAATSVVVFAGVQTDVFITLLPYPPDGGGVGINTAPHLVSVSNQPDPILMDGTAALSATAVDPDAGDLLTYIWNDNGIGGAFDGNGQQFLSGLNDQVSYTPPEGFTGAVLIQLSVHDRMGASATTAFHLVVNGTGIHPVLSFDALPFLVIDNVARQALLPGQSTQLSYAVIGITLPVTGLWTDSCLGTFFPNDPTAAISEGEQFVTYHAPPGGNGETPCELKFTLTDQALASEWSSALVWVQDLGQVVFATTTQFAGGTFGGSLEEADILCTATATAAVFAGWIPPGSRYTAFLSNSTTDAADRIQDATYVLVDGTLAISNKTDVFDWGLLHQINRNELGGVQSGLVFTGTNADGTRADNNCLDWTSFNGDDDAGTVGSTGSLDASWVNAGWMSCNQSASVYCFETRERL